MKDAINHPEHYNAHPSGIECIDVVEHMSFNLGNAIKYIWRCDHKKDAIEDLKKAIWLIQREISRREKEKEAKPEPEKKPVAIDQHGNLFYINRDKDRTVFSPCGSGGLSVMTYDANGRTYVNGIMVDTPYTQPKPKPAKTEPKPEPTKTEMPPIEEHNELTLFKIYEGDNDIGYLPHGVIAFGTYEAKHTGDIITIGPTASNHTIKLRSKYTIRGFNCSCTVFYAPSGFYLVPKPDVTEPKPEANPDDWEKLQFCGSWYKTTPNLTEWKHIPEGYYGGYQEGTIITILTEFDVTLKYQSERGTKDITTCIVFVNDKREAFLLPPGAKLSVPLKN